MPKRQTRSSTQRRPRPRCNRGSRTASGPLRPARCLSASRRAPTRCLMETVTTPASESVDVILRDGGTLRLRPPTDADSEALLDFYRALSSQSLHRRFHGFPNCQAAAGRVAARSGLGRARRAAGRAGGRERRADRRDRQLRASARSGHGGVRLCRRRRRAGTRDRDAAAGAAGGPRCRGRDRALRRRGARREPVDARCVRARRLRAHARARRAASSRCSSRSRRPSGSS